MKHVRMDGRRPRASALFGALAALAVVSFLAGCAGQQATISPTVVVDKETLGHGRSFLGGC